ncbi:MAG: folylpolyglutamate synthase/dihydrofolate synthase family protein [Oscillospiraceae bacterium]|nr:folylpolyglutamate synthase/dihydrofolate synthase family protein [Oscillospiraceae bacterium]
MMTYTEALEYIHARPRFAHEPGLAVMRGLMRRLGDPQKRLKCIHIAGTNGKGSTAAYLASILQRAGFKTGRTVSPYVLDFRERFEINAEMIAADTLAALAEEVKAEADSMEAWGEGAPGEFEVVTAIAFLWFAQEGCDVVVLEAGLGGRYDATNIIEAENTLVSCILRIGLDHRDVLGDTIEKIAAEKCGILKPGVPVVSYPRQPAGARKLIEKSARELGCEYLVPDAQDARLLTDGLFYNRIDYGGYETELAIMGRHQVYNAAVAIETALTLWRVYGMEISDEAILEGLSGAAFPGRCEVVSRDPLIVIDGCHNIDSAAALAETLDKSGLPRFVGIVGMLADKETDAVLKLLSDVLGTVYTVTPDSPRAMKAEDLCKKAKPYFESVQPMPSVQAALKAAEQTIGGRRGLCICGSLFLAAESRKILVNDKNS